MEQQIIKIPNFKLNVFRNLLEQSLIVNNQLMLEFSPDIVKSCSFSLTNSFMKLWTAPLKNLLFVEQPNNDIDSPDLFAQTKIEEVALSGGFKAWLVANNDIPVISNNILIKDAGFKNITLQKEKPIIVPNDILKNYLTDEEIAIYNSKPTIIFSITIYGEKQENCCSSETKCC